MNQAEFDRILKFHLDGLSIKDQVDMLQQIEYEWLRSYRIRLLNDYRLCKACNTYSERSKYKSYKITETHIQPTYTDAGYGDSDMYGENLYLVEYSICPVCGAKHEVNKIYIRTLWEKYRKE